MENPRFARCHFEYLFRMRVMRAWLLTEYGGLQNLRETEVADPVASAGDLVLDLQFAALNPADRYLAQGEYPARPAVPHVLGRDGIGIVSAVGPEVTDFKMGQQLLVIRGDTGVYRWGTFAEKVAVGSDSVATVPEGWTTEQAACASLVYLTAYQALTQWGELAQSTVLVTGASGGVGVAGIQLAKALGHTVVALSRGNEKRGRLVDLGADQVVDPTDAEWTKSLLKMLDGRRVDLAIDNIGGTLLPQVISVMGSHGRISLVGRLAGPVPQFNTAALFFRRLRMGGVAVGTYSRNEAHAAWKAVVELLGKTGATPVIDRAFSFEQLPEAFKRLAEGPMGKILLKIRE
jgi:NADPH2:quinone reductase